jgi:small subunit ribosomal protein S6
MSETENSYESVIVVSVTKGDDGNAEIIERFKKLISENATLENVDDWGKRRLAYPIQKQVEAYYTLINFKSEPDFTLELDRRLKIADGVVRSLIIKKDPRYLNTGKNAKSVSAKPIDIESTAEDTAVQIETNTEESVAPVQEPAKVETTANNDENKNE